MQRTGELDAACLTEYDKGMQLLRQYDDFGRVLKLRQSGLISVNR